MRGSPVSSHEQERLKAVEEYAILDTVPEADFDDIAAAAAEICDTPISFISIIDATRQWYKAQYGIKITETSPEQSLCLPAMQSTDHTTIIADLTKDKRLRKHPLVIKKPRVVFYAGVRLVNPQGFVLGTLCVLDTRTRKLNEKQVHMLQALGRQVVLLMELRKKDTQLRQTQKELSSTNHDIEQVAHIASHDLKSPLNNIISLTHLLKDEYSALMNEEGNEYLAFLNEASYRLSDLISGIVTYIRSAHMAVDAKETFSVSGLIEEVAHSLNIPANASLKYKKNSGVIHASRNALKLILAHLIHNAIHYNDSEHPKVEIKCNESTLAYTFEVKDNGPGILPEYRGKVFNLFERLNNQIKDGESMGVGLAVVKRLVEKTGGEIKLDPGTKKGSCFLFTLPK